MAAGTATSTSSKWQLPGRRRVSVTPWPTHYTVRLSFAGRVNSFEVQVARASHWLQRHDFKAQVRLKLNRDCQWIEPRRSGRTGTVALARAAAAVTVIINGL